MRAEEVQGCVPYVTVSRGGQRAVLRSHGSQHHGGATGRRVTMTVVQRGGRTGMTSRAADADVADIQFVCAPRQPRRGERTMAWHGDQVERAHGEALEEDLHPEIQGCV